ncbi:MAG: bifunctional enzyme conserved region, partial [Acidimicrobiaceae bacterium]|nr:bifunctional enzyme conserved region [Acidimicrobiaceae bacterium]
MESEIVEVEGHIIDSLILAKVLDVIVDAGADYR